MKIILRFLFLSALIGLCGFNWPFSFLFSEKNPEQFGTQLWLNKQINILKNHATGIDPEVLRLSLTAYINAKKNGFSQNKELLTVIDYSKPSTEKRLWVFDIKNGKTLFHTWVSHGKNSGDLIPTSFSNITGSLKSSFGLFVTDIQPYMGGHGYSLRLKGLEAGINDNAYNRDIVVHGAWYVNADTIKQYGRIGRSWGCPAVSANLVKPIINTIKDKTLVFAYYPDKKWLSGSRFLRA